MTGRVRGRRIASLAGIVLLLIGAWLVPTGRVEAHALLVRADPQINAVLLESPQLMNLFFSEPLQRDFSGVQVLDSTGARVDLGEVTFNPDDATNMVVRVRSLSPGVYTVVWNTLSQIDGHTWNGSHSFTVLNPDGSSPPGAAFTPTLSMPGPGAAADAAVKWFSFAAVIAFVGGMLFVRLAAIPAARALPGRCCFSRRQPTTPSPGGSG
jgi:methionine-rich copper-binding protein CopC